MVFAMVVIGGLTRLTESGLSIVEWRPFTGWIPPMSDAEWQTLFDAYKQYPEYQKINFGMSLAQFQGIFWLEFIHRLWGRLIGLAFFVPFVIFLARGWIGRAMVPKLGFIFLLGALQGALGWYMVASGLIDRPDVSQYRLVAHLGLALVIYAALVWTGLSLMIASPSTDRVSVRLSRSSLLLPAMVLLTILAGGIVAGTNAGFVYNTFPLMDGQLVPDQMFSLTPIYLNFFEDLTTVQFTHRLLATLTLITVLGFGWSVRRALSAGRARRVVLAMMLAVIVQFSLGVSTLLLVVPLPLAALHQAWAVVVWTLALWTAFEMQSARVVAESSPVSGRGRALLGDT